MKVVAVIDWDDTFLASAKLQLETYRQRKEHIMHLQPSKALLSQLHHLSLTIIRFLDRMQAIGTVYIVTNAQTGWVLESCARFMPMLLPRLLGTKMYPPIPVISAADLYHEKKIGLSEEGCDWKYYVICQILILEARHSVILFGMGDSEAERDAFRRINREMLTPSLSYPSPLKTRFVKMLEAPSIPGLVHQLTVLTGSLQHFIIKSESAEHTLKGTSTDSALPLPGGF